MSLPVMSLQSCLPPSFLLCSAERSSLHSVRTLVERLVTPLASKGVDCSMGLWSKDSINIYIFLGESAELLPPPHTHHSIILA